MSILISIMTEDDVAEIFRLRVFREGDKPWLPALDAETFFGVGC